MAQPPSDRLTTTSAQPTLAPAPGTATVRVANIVVRTPGPKDHDQRTPGAPDSKDKKKPADAMHEFSSDAILVTSEDLRQFADANASDDEASGRVNIPAINFS